MAITAAEAILIRTLINAALIEITKKVQKMKPEELLAAQAVAEAKTKTLMDEIDSH